MSRRLGISLPTSALTRAQLTAEPMERVSILLEMNPTNGELSQPTLAAKTRNPSWICIHPSRKYLYAINEITDYEGKNGSVSAFELDETSGSLTALNTVSSGGAGPAHMSIDASGPLRVCGELRGRQHRRASNSRRRFARLRRGCPPGQRLFGINACDRCPERQLCNQRSRCSARAHDFRRIHTISSSFQLTWDKTESISTGSTPRPAS